MSTGQSALLEHVFGGNKALYEAVGLLPLVTVGVYGINYAAKSAKNKETIDKVNKAIDKLKRKNKPINFETVCKEAGVSRATLYNNAQLKERILSLRAISKASPLDDVVAVKKDKLQLKDEKINALREQVKKLEEDKKKLIVQLVDYEELKSENERLKKQLAKK